MRGAVTVSAATLLRRRPTPDTRSAAPGTWLPTPPFCVNWGHCGNEWAAPGVVALETRFTLRLNHRAGSHPRETVPAGGTTQACGGRYPLATPRPETRC